VTAAFAFFDVDGTLINSRSLISFLAYLRPVIAADRFDAYWRALQRGVWGKMPRHELNRLYFTVLEGLSQAQVRAQGLAWFEAESLGPDFFNSEGLDLLQTQRSRGFAICLVTGSFRELMVPLAAALQIPEMLCSEPEVVQGRFTGALVGDPCIGIRKLERATQFAQQYGVALRDCVAVGDDDSDRPLLAQVGHGRLLAPQAAYAVELERVFGSPPASACIQAGAVYG
jgi:HAD superfamily hydrolase (TIGR01490 family)